MVRRLAAVAGVILALLVVISIAATAWLVSQVQGFLEPPPDPAGQSSITSYLQTADQTGLENRSSSLWQGRFEWNRIDTPPLSARPWTRWWWPGGAVEAETLKHQLDVLYQAGFGGVEVQPFLSGAGRVADNESVMNQIYSFDSPAYYDTLNEMIEYVALRGMQVDLTHFSGWPPGGPEVALEDSLTILAYGETTVSGGKTVSIELPAPKPGPGEYIFSAIEFSGADFINFPAEQAKLLNVVAAKTRDGKHRWNPFNLDDTVTLDEDSLRVLDEQVSSGRLDWEAPEGDWTIIANYLLPSGEVPIGSAQQPQGFVVDHLRKPQVLGHYEYAYGERTGLPAQYGKGLRGFFNDSLEFRLRRMAAKDILEEFQQRRGYDLSPYLPAVYIEGVDNMYFTEILGAHAAPEFELTPLDERIRYDYQQTLSDLMIERFVETSAEWAGDRGLLSRGQSYGMDIDLLRALGANSIPETEQLWADGANVGLKFASSAAALYGRPLVSAESFVWINRDYLPTARRLKAAADKLFLAGINHIVYHGTPYPWQGEVDDEGEAAFGEEGWAPFSGPENPAHFSGNYSPANTAIWPDIPDLNRYIARSQNLLRQGSPSVDVLIYYPFLGFHGTSWKSDSAEVLVSGSLPDATLASATELMDRVLTVPADHEDERATWVTKLQPLLEALDSHGISWGWVNDHALQTGKLRAGQLVESGGRYGAILLPNIEAMPPATLAALTQQLQDDVPVLFAGSLPERQRSFHHAEAGDQAVRAGVTALLGQGAAQLELSVDALLPELVQASRAALRYDGPSTIHRYRRVLDGGAEILFLGNQSAKRARLLLNAPGDDEHLWWFDARDGVAWPARPQSGLLSVMLDGFASRFLVRGLPMPEDLNNPPLEQIERNWYLEKWQLTLGGYLSQLDKLVDWRDLPELRYAHGPGRYLHTLTLDSLNQDARYLLDLGLVQGSAKVIVNGQEMGRASLPPFFLDIAGALVSGENRIEVEVLAPLRNAFVGRALAANPLYSNMKIYKNQLAAAGLMGPVTLYESIPIDGLPVTSQIGMPNSIRR